MMPREPHTIRHRAGSPRARRGPLADPARRQAAQRGRRALVRPGQARPGRPGRRSAAGHLGGGRARDHRGPQRRCADHRALGPAARPAGPGRAARHTAGPGQTTRAAVPVAGRAEGAAAGCRSRWRRCGFPASSRPAPTTRSATSSGSAAWPTPGAATSSTSAPSATSTRLSGYGDWLGAEALLGILNGKRAGTGTDRVTWPRVTAAATSGPSTATAPELLTHPSTVLCLSRFP